MTDLDGPSGTHDSSSLELMIESVFLGELLQECWFTRRHVVDVLHSTVDSFGYDVVLQAGDVIRHVQLKGRRKGSKTSSWGISAQLAVPPAGCVVLIEWEEDVRAHRMDLSYRWFGNGPRERLPDLGSVPVRHTRANSRGEKAVRADRFKVGVSRFERVEGIADLAGRLFGRVA